MVQIHIIKGAVHMCLFSYLSPISQQPLGRFGQCLAGRWVLSVPLWIPKIRMISHRPRIVYNTLKLDCVSFRTSVPSILNAFSQQPLARFSPKLARWWVLTVALWILKIRIIGHMVRIQYHKRSCPYVSIFLSVTHFSATAWLNWTMLGRKVGSVSTFMNPENQDDVTWSGFHMIKKAFRGEAFQTFLSPLSYLLWNGHLLILLKNVWID